MRTGFAQKRSARVEDSFEEFLGGSEEHILRARYEYLECCIKYNEAVEIPGGPSAVNEAIAPKVGEKLFENRFRG